MSNKLEHSYWESAAFRIHIGAVGFICAIVLTMLDQFTDYEANYKLVDTLYYSSVALMTAGIVKVFKKQSNPPAHNNSDIENQG